MAESRSFNWKIATYYKKKNMFGGLSTFNEVKVLQAVLI